MCPRFMNIFACKTMRNVNLEQNNGYDQWRTVGQRIGGGGGAPSGKVTNARVWEGGCPPSQGREIFQFWGQNRVIWCMQ